MTSFLSSRPKAHQSRSGEILMYVMCHITLCAGKDRHIRFPVYPTRKASGMLDILSIVPLCKTSSSTQGTIFDNLHRKAEGAACVLCFPSLTSVYPYHLLHTAGSPARMHAFCLRCTNLQNVHASKTQSYASWTGKNLCSIKQKNKYVWPPCHYHKANGSPPTIPTMLKT